MKKEKIINHSIIWSLFLIPCFLFFLTSFLDIAYYLYYFIFIFPVLLYLKSEDRKIMLLYFLFFYLILLVLFKYFYVSINLIPFG